VVGNVDLDSNVKSKVRLEDGVNGIHPILNLKGHTLSVDSGGIVVGTSNGAFIHGPGYLTSTGGMLDISVNVRTASDKGLNIEASISDNGNERVGLRIMGNSNMEGVVFLTGKTSNSFTGNVHIHGKYKYLVLGKSNGAVAVKGDIYVRDGAVLNFANSNQTLKTSSVFLDNSSLILYSGVAADTRNRLKTLTVDGSGIIAFDNTSVFKFKKYLYLDDLLVVLGGSLTVTGWLNGQDFLLVRKSSQSLADELKKLNFQGYDRNNIHLVDFNKDYWEISAAPEPVTYGVILGGLGLAVAVSRRRKRRSDP